MGRVNDVVKGCGELAAVPDTVVRVAAMLTDGAFDAAEIERIVRADEALSAAVLRTANSVRFGSPGKVFELKDSIIRLGSKNLLKIVLDMKADELFQSAGEAYGLRRHGLWRSSIAGAVAAELIAETHKACDPSKAYLAALLRDIGKLAIESSLGRHALDNATQANADDTGFLGAEHAAIGVDHAEVGASLAEQWGLPPELCNAIRYHHTPPAPGEDGASPLIDVVHAADTVALWSGLAIGDDGLCYRLAEHVEDSLGITRKEVEREIAETWFRVREIEKLIGLDTQQGAA